MKKEKEKETRVSKFYNETYIIETVYNNKTPKFAVLNGNGIEIKGGIKPTTNPDLWLLPYKDPFGNLEKNIVILPTDVQSYNSTENLLQDIKSFISSFAYLPEFWLNISTYYALMSWIYDCFGAVPYIDFLGDKDSGKTRIGDVIANCCYNSIVITGASTVAPMFRLIDRYPGTMFIDEADYKNSELDTEIAKILNVGYRNGGAVLRAEKYDGSYEPRAFVVYGPKIITHRRPFGDDATSSRCLTYKVPKSFELPSHIPSQIPVGKDNPFTKAATEIRNKCLRWRFDNLRTVKPDTSINIGISSRYREIAVPMLTLITEQSIRKEFLQFLGDTAINVKIGSDNYLCIRVIQKLYNKEKGLKQVIELAEIVQGMNIESHDDEKSFSGKSVGTILSSMGLDTKRGGTSGRYRLTPSSKNEQQLELLFHEYKNSEDSE